MPFFTWALVKAAEEYGRSSRDTNSCVGLHGLGQKRLQMWTVSKQISKCAVGEEPGPSDMPAKRKRKHNTSDQTSEQAPKQKKRGKRKMI